MNDKSGPAEYAAMRYEPPKLTKLCVPVLLAALWAPLAAAQSFTLPPSAPAPSAAGLLSPASGAVFKATPAGISLPLSWYQGARALEPEQRPQAAWFVICVYDPAAFQFCRWPPAFGALPYLRTEPASSIPHTPSVPPEGPAGSLTYWHTAGPLPFVPRTQRLVWQIGACSQPQHAHCRFSEARTATLTPHDLVAARLRVSQQGSALAFSASVRNDGAAPSPPHTTTVKAVQVVAPTACNPLTDYRQLPGLLANTNILLRDGSVVHRRTNPPLDQVIGIIVLGQPVMERTATSSDETAPGMQRVAVDVQGGSSSRSATYVAWMHTRIDGGEVDAAPSNNTRYDALCWR